MAITFLDLGKNQWYVEYADGTREPCHNRATAAKLARDANDDREGYNSETFRNLQHVQEVTA